MERDGKQYARWGTGIVFILLLNGAFCCAATDNASAFTDGDYIYTLSLSKGGWVATITGYTGVGGSITIPSAVGGEDYAVRAIGDDAFRDQDSLTVVTIPNGVTRIGSHSFYDCDNLHQVFFPNTLTTIEASAFERCAVLIGVEIPDSTKTIEENAFFHCDSLYYVYIGTGVTTIGSYAFGYCFDLHEIVVSGGNLDFASDNGILYDKEKTVLLCCPGGKSGAVTIPNSVTTIGASAFQMCSSITSVTLPSSVREIKAAAFYSCQSLASVNIPSGITTIEALTFFDCSSLTHISIPDSVTTLSDDAFNSCTSLNTVALGSGVTTIGDWVFKLCTSLTSIIFTGLVAPINVGGHWLQDANAGIRGHAYPASNFPPPGGVWNGLTMGEALPASPPGAPTGVTAIPGDGQVTLTWAAPADIGGASIDHYVVYKNGLDVTHVVGTSTTLTGLTNGVSYNFAVAAHNSAGLGEMSTVVSAVPRPPLTVVVPPGAPTGLIATPGDGLVHLTWTAPVDDGGGEIDYYVVYQNGLDVAHVGETMATLMGLTNGVSYNFAVAAHNSAGLGTTSTVISVTPSTTATVPDPPTGLTATPGDGQVQLVWEPPSNNGGLNVTGYRIYWGSDPDSSHGPMVVNGTAYLHKGLENGHTIFYWVSAVNGVGESGISNVVSATPSGSYSLPSAPSGLAASILDGKVALNWTAPSVGQNITSYKVYRGMSSTTMQEIASVADTVYTDGTVSGGRTYYYQVSAVNDNGEGDRSTMVNITVTSAASGGSFLDSLAGQATLVGLLVAAAGGAGYLLWRRKRT